MTAKKLTETAGRESELVEELRIEFLSEFELGKKVVSVKAWEEEEERREEYLQNTQSSFSLLNSDKVAAIPHLREESTTTAATT